MVVLVPVVQGGGFAVVQAAVLGGGGSLKILPAFAVRPAAFTADKADFGVVAHFVQYIGGEYVVGEGFAVAAEQGGDFRQIETAADDLAEINLLGGVLRELGKQRGQVVIQTGARADNGIAVRHLRPVGVFVEQKSAVIGDAGGAGVLFQRLQHHRAVVQAINVAAAAGGGKGKRAGAAADIEQGAVLRPVDGSEQGADVAALAAFAAVERGSFGVPLAAGLGAVADAPHMAPVVFGKIGFGQDAADRVHGKTAFGRQPEKGGDREKAA